MKKSLPYILGGLALLLLLALVYTTPVRKNKKLDERITLRQRDKIPYGTFVAHNLLAYLFPNASISTDKKEPSYWNEVSVAVGNQAVFLVAKSFEPEEYELKRLSEFVNKGNYVFIIANSLSYEAARYFKVDNANGIYHYRGQDSLQVTLNQPPFSTRTSFLYPGKGFDNYFSEVDTAKTLLLGHDEHGMPDFIQLQSGKGKLFIHLAPLAFSNYFLLHKNNTRYFQQAVSLIPDSVHKVLWNEYYLTKRKIKNEKETNILSVLWQYHSFRWALITAIVTLLLYTLQEARRRQRLVPARSQKVNGSLDFVRTMGRLYYDQNDHQNLSKKMTVHFLDYVRTRFGIRSQNLDDNFLKDLQAKSGYPAPNLERLVAFMQYVEGDGKVTEVQLADYYNQLENFYANTTDGRTPL